MITGTHFNYYMVCIRKLWLFANGIQMEHTSELVYEGRLVHESSYPQRSERYTEIELAGIKIDYYDAHNRVIHEVKKTDSYEQAHEWQLKYYIYCLELNGVDGVTGLLEYPKLRETQEVLLSDVDRVKMAEIETDIQRIIADETCPKCLPRARCKNCSYFDFCWSGEEPPQD
jgi:CRISPR-associated exonuclease Cas4